ncbi:MAG: hypothetical protein GY945_09550 [Rhodobacteraceae bacterium]|nr:hypothetical protein [Paracoccaceae bacterium]
MPNILASFMLAIWPLVALVLFRRLRPAQAVVWTLLAGYLILPPPPAAFDFPLFPPFNKVTIPSLSAFLLVIVTTRQNVRLIPQSRLAQALLLIYVLSPFATYATNTDPVFYGTVGLPGMRFVEGIALLVQQAMLAMPFLLGAALLAGKDGLRTIAIALFAGGLVYSLPMLIEVRLSPQINNWVYGYYQHIFGQSVRFGGFRPLVFLDHGLWAAFYAMTAFTAALALFRSELGRANGKYLLAAGYLGLVLVLCKSVGAALYGLLLMPLLLFLGVKWQLRLAAVLAVLSFAYPVLRGADLVPVEAMVEQAAKFDENRAASLKFRFDNEDILFERALRKPAFGWGSWGRNHILDPISGNIQTVTDGRWIITLGVFGWLGFVAEFGLLTLPIIALWHQARRRGSKLPLLTGPLALLLAINIVDLLPNATLTPLTWLIAGALLGTADRMRESYSPPKLKKLRTVL